MSFEITAISGKEIKDSRNNPTLEVTVFIGEESATFQVPSGASTGAHEALELRDDGNAKGGMTRAIHQLDTLITPALIGMDVTKQGDIDATLLRIDNTENKTNLGGNTMLGVSIAVAKLAAKVTGKETYEYLRSLRTIKESRPFPHLYANLVNGGKHAHNELAFQEYHTVPQGKDFSESLIILDQVQRELGVIVKEKYGDNTKLGDEGGFDIPAHTIEEPLQLLVQAVEQSGHEGNVRFALDVAADSFYDKEKKTYHVDGKDITEQELMDIYGMLIAKYSFLSIEDPFYEEAFDAFKVLREKHPDVTIVGDDLTVTNSKRLEHAFENNSIGALIIKPNQIGTLTETLATMEYARNHDIECIVSHRSGETMDDFIADLTVAFSCFGIKAGARGPKEREVKYSRLRTIIV